MSTQNNTNMLEKRFAELNYRACEKRYNTYTDFLNLEEQSVLAESYLPCVRYGGYDGAERVVACFGDEENPEFPILCIKIRPTAQRFADKLSHRDFLGALMNLGIKRELLGDIIIENNCGYLFCLERIAEYITDNLERVRHTSVRAEIIDEHPLVATQQGEEKEMIVASLRLDVLIAAVYKLSRRESLLLFQQGKVFVNSRQTTNSSYTVKENDIVSVRGLGRFQYLEQLRTTKKDRLVAGLRIYR